MSEENVEIVRAAFAAWNAGDMEALGDLYAVDAVTSGLDNWPEAGPNVGREAVIRQYEQMRETWDADAVEVLGDPLDVGDRIAVRLSWRAAGHGPALNIEMTGVFTVRDGKIHGVDFFWDHAEALEAMRATERPA